MHNDRCKLLGIYLELSCQKNTYHEQKRKHIKISSKGRADCKLDPQSQKGQVKHPPHQVYPFHLAAWQLPSEQDFQPECC